MHCPWPPRGGELCCGNGTAPNVPWVMMAVAVGAGTGPVEPLMTPRLELVQVLGPASAPEPWLEPDSDPDPAALVQLPGAKAAADACRVLATPETRFSATPLAASGTLPTTASIRALLAVPSSVAVLNTTVQKPACSKAAFLAWSPDTRASPSACRDVTVC